MSGVVLVLLLLLLSPPPPPMSSWADTSDMQTVAILNLSIIEGMYMELSGE